MFGKIWDISEINLASIDDTSLCNLLLYGNTHSNRIDNSVIIEATISYIKTTGRSDLGYWIFEAPAAFLLFFTLTFHCMSEARCREGLSKFYIKLTSIQSKIIIIYIYFTRSFHGNFWHLS